MTSHARLDSAMIGGVPESSLSPRMREALGLYRKYQDMVNTDYNRKQRAQKRQQVRGRVQLAGSNIFMDESVRSRDVVSALRTQRIQVVTEVLEADICLVADVVHMPEIVHWALMIGGGQACDDEYILNNGNAGRSLFMEAHNQKKLVAWFSRSFAREYPHLAHPLVNKISVSPTWHLALGTEQG